MAAGGLAAAAAVLADLFGGGRGLGLSQFLAALLGVAVFAVGAYLRPACRTWASEALARSPGVRPSQCLVLGVWFGLVVGFFEVGHQTVREQGFGVSVKQPDHFVWMVPVSYLVYFGVIGGALGLLRRFTAAVTFPVVVFVPVALGVWTQLLPHEWLDSGVALVLSVVVAWQLAGASVTHAEGSWRWCRRSLVWLLVLVGVAGAAVPGWRAFEEGRAMDALPPPPRGTPNVLLLVLDTVRADNMASFGYERTRTPVIDELARRSVVFERAYSTAPWTLTSHATMFTGQYPHRTTADWTTPLDDEHRTLAETLSEYGYATGGFVGNLTMCTRAHGVARGFSRFQDYGVTLPVLLMSSNLGLKLWKTSSNRFRDRIRNDAETIADRFLGWLDDREERPFFAFLNFYDAHAYYFAPPGYDDMFGPPSKLLRQWSPGRYRWTEEERQGFVDAYDGCIAYIDSQLRRIFDQLKSDGLLDDTVIIVTSDHGELFGEKKLYGHGNSLYRPLLHVPLVVTMPDGAGAGARVPEFVSLRDLGATILDLVGAEDELPGTSLAPLWATERGPVPELSPVYAEVSYRDNFPDQSPVTEEGMGCVVVGGVQVTFVGDEVHEIFDLVSDPKHEHDLVQVGLSDDVKSRAVPALERLVREETGRIRGHAEAALRFIRAR